ncbi:MAG: hypothetical protein K1000chlam2_01389 [Chlamydiae bacterium]|nr:hypothetical protein [Chlamydiota bacterium]
MTNTLYLGGAFGWETESRAKVAISQLRQGSKFFNENCPKAQLIKNGSIRWQANLVKILGYIPIINVLAGVVAITCAENGYEPRNKQMWICRGVAMIFTGPLLLIVDLVKFIFDSTIVAKYNRENPERIEAFNTSHTHSHPFWPGHPIRCEEATV